MMLLSLALFAVVRVALAFKAKQGAQIFVPLVFLNGATSGLLFFLNPGGQSNI